MQQIIEFILHIDKYLLVILKDFGAWSYLIIFGIIFAETGLVVTPFLPGDSLLFAIGAISVKGGFNIFVAYIVLISAAVIGDAANYYIGHKIGRKAFRGKHIFKKEHLESTELFYERHGGKTIILARFVPIIRTFAPFVAGIGKMNYPRFLSFNIVGAVGWVTLFLFSGYFFGNLPIIKDNFTFVIIAIIIISVLPGVYQYVKERKLKEKNA